MRTYTVYLDTKTGRSQVSLKAEKVEVNETAYQFFAEGRKVAEFAKDNVFGFMEEEGPEGWAGEEPPTAA